jgi:hypothetical protein
MSDPLEEAKMGRRTVYVDKNKIEELGNRGVDVNELVRATIDLALSEEFEDLAVDSKLRQLSSDLTEITVELAHIEERRTFLLTQQSELTEEKVFIESTREQTKRRAYLGRYIRSLNQIIVMNNYDYPTVVAVTKDLVNDITRMEPSFQLEPHMVMLKKYLHH